MDFYQSVVQSIEKTPSGHWQQTLSIYCGEDVNPKKTHPVTEIFNQSALVIRACQKKIELLLY
jgi:hypothetical protein